MAKIDTMPTATEIRVERRLAGRALAHWEGLRSPDGLPARGEYSSRGLPFESDFHFMIELNGDSGGRIVEAGETVTDALGADIVGRRAEEVFPSSVDFGLSFYRTAAALKKPIADVGQFTDRDGRDIAYRCILLPLSDDRRTVSCVAGAFSYKYRS